MSTTSLAIIAATITAVYQSITQIFGIYSARKQRQVDRENELQSRRAEAYQRYLTAYHRAFAKRNSANHEPAQGQDKAEEAYWLAYSNLFQVASDTVLLSVFDFHEAAWINVGDLTGDAYDTMFRERCAAMLLEMRTDGDRMTRLVPREIEKRIPFRMQVANKPHAPDVRE